MASKPTKLTVDNSGYFRVGDIVRMADDTYVVTAQNARMEHGVRRVPLLRGLWRFLRGRGAFTEAYEIGKTHTLRVWKWRPSPLPRRLP